MDARTIAKITRIATTIARAREPPRVLDEPRRGDLAVPSHHLMIHGVGPWSHDELRGIVLCPTATMQLGMIPVAGEAAGRDRRPMHWRGIARQDDVFDGSRRRLSARRPQHLARPRPHRCIVADLHDHLKSERRRPRATSLDDLRQDARRVRLWRPPGRFAALPPRRDQSPIAVQYLAYTFLDRRFACTLMGARARL